ncbi:MAG: ATP-binding protein, partial [Lachnospiraceae bacterium]|nr:ATP-binding protein [Lachnospiraceae bacterium]
GRGKAGFSRPSKGFSRLLEGLLHIEKRSDNMSEYTADSIQVLSDMAHIRTRPGMYVDGVDDPRQLFSEAFDNAIDEAQSGFSDVTEVSVDTENHIYMVRDHGRGIPIGLKATKEGPQVETLQLLATKSFSGGKFDNSNYKLRGGLHGVGLGCCNALSDLFEIATHRDGQAVYLHCEKGEVQSLVYYPTSEPNGVAISIQADPTIYDSVDIPLDFIKNRCIVAQAFGYPQRLYINGELHEIPVERVADLIPADDANVSQYAEFEVSAKIESGEFIRVVLRYTSETNSKFYGYSNLIYNRYGGTHNRLLDRAIEEVWKEFYEESEGVELRDSDCKIGLRALCAVFIEDVAFSSQTKDKLTVKNEALYPLIDAFKSEFRNQLENNPDLRKALIKRFAEYRASQNRLTARKEIMELVKVNGRNESGTVRRKSVVRGLIECTSPQLEGTELYLVEGNSAAGPAARARNKKLQSVLPLRGKIKNITYMSIAQALKSEDIRRIVNATGAGVGDETDPERCRYEKIIIAADADPDGRHITALEISVYVNLMPALVKAGRVYVLEPPLFGYKENGKYVFTDNFLEIPEKLRTTKGYTRYKGLGEMDDDEFRESCFIPGQRRLYQVQYPDDIDAFNRILGSTGGRKELFSDLGIIKYVNGAVEDSGDCEGDL